MNPQDPLAELHPLREPALIEWWPPAPGWWILLGLLLVLAGVSAYVFWRRYRRNAYRRAAQARLRQIRADFSEHGDTQLCLTRVNALLKSVALHAYPRELVASASGREWLELLNSELPTDRQLPAEYIAGLYAAHSNCVAMDSTLAAAGTWISRHQGQRS